MVSVIIPNYNHSEFLIQRIESVLKQTYQEFELIILDDCSSDNSREIINAFKDDPKITHIIFNEKNSGSVFLQWKKGVELSKGNLIWIAESDDYAAPNFLEKLVPMIEDDQNVGLVYCDTHIVNQTNILSTETYADIRNKMSATTKWSYSYQRLGIEEIKENLLNYCTINNVSAVIFNKQAFINVNPFDREFKYVGDWFCYLKLCSQYSIKYLNEPLSFYRIHPNNASKDLNNNNQFLLEHFTLFDWVVRNLPAISLAKKKQAFIVYIKQNTFRRWWGLDKLSGYRMLFKINSGLFFFMIKEYLKNIKSRQAHSFLKF